MNHFLGFRVYSMEQVVEFARGCCNNLLALFGYIVVTILLIKGANVLIEKMFQKLLSTTEEIEQKKQIATIKNLVKSLSKIIIVLLVFLSFLGRYNIDIRPLLTAAGVVGVAVGFAARRFVEDIIMGIFILLEGQVRVGDFVNIDGMDGFVEKVTLKMVIIRNINGHVHYIRNGMINVITNKTRGFAFPVVDIGVAYESDINKVIDVMKSVGAELRKDEALSAYILDDVKVLGIQSFDDSAIVVRAVLKSDSLHQWDVERAYKKLVKEAFDRENISIPFPQRDIRIVKG